MMLTKAEREAVVAEIETVVADTIPSEFNFTIEYVVGFMARPFCRVEIILGLRYVPIRFYKEHPDLVKDQVGVAVNVLLNELKEDE